MQRKVKRTLITAALTAALSLPSLPAMAGGGMPGAATELTQIANNLELGAILGKEVQQIAQQLKMLNDMVRNTKQLTSGQWTNIHGDILALANAIQRGEALAYALSNLEQEYENKYPDYRSYREERRYEDVEELMEQLADTNRDTTISAMRAVGLQGKQFESEYDVLDELTRLSQTAEGRMQALQAGNLIAAQQVGQMQKLRQLQMTQIQMHAAYQSREDAKEAQHDAFKKKFFKMDTSTLIKGNSMEF